MECIVVCNGWSITKELVDKYINKDTYIICADGGANHLKKFGILPDILLGDFDSISDEALEFYNNKKIEILNFPPEKDYTDSELSVETAISKGFKDIIVLGGIGSRMDHTIANVFLLKMIHEAGCKGRLIDDNNIIQLTSSDITLEKHEGYKVTLLPMTPTVEGITTKGLYYPLDNYTMRQGSTRGVSNEFLEEEAYVSIKSGLLLVMMSRD
jgi:thiamine pyrophosphokinase